ncbi:MAG: hypothetical protein KF862_06845 [Chitinophagaceae bacterium]|nr:hypothetical protein [Chitinophagaceae bacterium]
MRYLPFVSCCWLLVCTAACSSPYKKMQQFTGNAGCVQSFTPVFTTALYNTQVNVAGKHLSGILIIKTMPDSSTRMVFSNEAGFKFFDFGFDDKGFTVYYIVSQMDKRPVIKTLRKDFELLLMKHVNAASYYTIKQAGEYYYVFPDGRDHYYYVTDSVCSRLIRMERGSKKKKVMEAVMQNGKDGTPDTIGIRHNNFSFDIGLKRLEHDPQR